ncbi:hypothetical protein B0T16DRAFT_439345, partial [Cercophora newfieldiana]
MNLPKALGELAEKPAGEIVETLATGMVQFGKDTVKAVGETGKYGYKAFTEGGDENWHKFGHAATDVVLNGVDIGLMVVGGVGAAKGAVNMGRALKVGGEAALESAKGTAKTFARTIAEGAETAPARVPALATGAGTMAAPGVDLLEAGNLMMRSAKTVYKGAKSAASAGGKAYKTTRKMQKLESAIKKLETGSSKLSKQYRYFKAGGELAEKAPITMEEALRKVGGKAKGLFKNARHHDAPQTLQKLFDALEYDNHAVTHVLNRRVHQLVHGMGGHFHDSNVLWAYKLAQTDLRSLTSAALDTIRGEINATFGDVMT